MMRTLYLALLRLASTTVPRISAADIAAVLFAATVLVQGT